MGGTCSTYGRGEKCLRNLSRHIEGKRPLGTRHWWEGNMKKDFRDTWCFNVDRINATQDRDTWGALVNTVTNLPFP
jgi:hypothetical protein